MKSKRSSTSSKSRRYSTSSTSSSEDEALIVLRQEKESNSYDALCQKSEQQCEFCDEVFRNRYTLYQHNITHMIIPLKKTENQCKLCLRRCSSASDLVTHTLSYHNKIILNPASQKKFNTASQEMVKSVSNKEVNPVPDKKVSQKKFSSVSQEKVNPVSLEVNRASQMLNKNEELPDILKSIVEKQVFVKCDDNINILVNSKLNKNDKRLTHNFESQNDNGNVDEIVQMRNDSIHNVSSGFHENTNLKEISLKQEYVSPSKKDSELKEEPFSPRSKRESTSSPTEDEKESIRHRLLFEEDIEDSLFRNISDECNLNIETLCKEVSLDYDNAIPVSDSDDAMSVDTFERLHGSDGLKNNGISDLESGFNDNNNGINNLENGIYNFSNGMNKNINYESELNSFVGDFNTHNFNNGFNLMNNTENRINFEQNGLNMANLDGNRVGFDFLTFSHVAKVNENATDLGNGGAIHYDELLEPKLSVCRICQKKFPHRFLLIQHEAKHLKVKKKHCWHIGLCCVCERYIAGNHYTLKKHMENKHPAQTNTNFVPRACQKCGLKYHSYNKHLEYQHGIYKCEKCDSEFDDLKQKYFHNCHVNPVKLKETDVSAKTMQLCDLCFTIMKVYMKNRQNYERIGTKSELGMRQTCDKCDKKYFSVNLVKRFSLRPVPQNDGPKASHSGQKNCQMASDGLKECFDKNTQKIKSMSINKYKPVKPMSNIERLLKIQNRLKMLKK